MPRPTDLYPRIRVHRYPVIERCSLGHCSLILFLFLGFADIASAQSLDSEVSIEPSQFIAPSLVDVTHLTKELQIEIAKLNSLLEEVKQQNQSLRNEWRNMNLERESFKKKMRQLKRDQEIADLKKEISELTVTLKQARENTSLIEAENNSCRSELSKESTDRENLAAEKKGLLVQISQLEKQLTMTKESLMSTEDEKSSLDKSVAQLQIQLANIKQANQNLTRKGEDLQKAYNGLQDNNRKRIQTIVQLESQSERIQGELSDALAKGASLEQERTKLADERDLLNVRVSELNETLTDYKTQIDQAGNKLTNLEHRLALVQARLPVHEGGTADAEVVGNRVAEKAAEYISFYTKEKTSSDDPEFQTKLQTAQDALNAEQFLFAQVIGAKSLYRVRTGDTLARIARRFYGTTGKWDTIFSANRHILDNPDFVLPGITLIIP